MATKCHAAAALKSSVLALARGPEGPLVLACFIGHFFSFGPIYAFGVFLPSFQAYFDISLAAATTIHSLMNAMQFVGSLLAGLLIPRCLHHRPVAIAGTVLILAGYLLASYAGSLTVLYLAMGPLVGTGLGACNLAGLTALNASIRERRAMAVGMATCGTSAGIIFLPLVYEALISAVGWRWALCTSGCTAAVAFGVTAPFIRVLPTSAGEGAASAGAVVNPQLPPCRDLRYLCWWLHIAVVFLGYFTPATLLAEFGQKELGLSAEAASAMYTIIGVAGFVTRVSLGCITASLGGARRTFCAALMATGLLTVIMPFCRSQASLLAWSALYGASLGPLIALISVILCELFGIHALPLYHGCSRLAVAVGTFAGPPLMSRLVDVAGYRVGFTVAGGLVLAGLPFQMLLACLQGRHLRAQAAGHGKPGLQRDGADYATKDRSGAEAELQPPEALGKNRPKSLAP